MMKTLILICALGMARADCTPETSVAVLQGPEAGSLAQCGFLGQAYLADTAMANYLDGEHYMKILCTAGDRNSPRQAQNSETQQAAEVRP
ncbi:MAG: hypothetical protein ACR2RF_24560 [Geminicoccaceae bacterium]